MEGCGTNKPVNVRAIGGMTLSTSKGRAINTAARIDREINRVIQIVGGHQVVVLIVKALEMIGAINR